MARNYTDYLNRLTDDIFAEAARHWDWETNSELNQWAREAGLHYMTIWKLGTRETKSPQLLTVWKLAKSVGWTMQLTQLKRRRVAA